jgi:hypothetical protein
MQDTNRGQCPKWVLGYIREVRCQGFEPRTR